MKCLKVNPTIKQKVVLQKKVQKLLAPIKIKRGTPEVVPPKVQSQRAKSKTYYQKNKVALNEKHKAYNKTNSVKINAKRNELRAEKKKKGLV
jgi:hypothetical protein